MKIYKQDNDYTIYQGAIMKERKKCCICEKDFDGWGNNAWPIKDGICCDECNNTKVLPARFVQYYKSKKEVK